jgi:tRNA-specific 2-thiouridylase
MCFLSNAAKVAPSLPTPLLARGLFFSYSTIMNVKGKKIYVGLSGGVDSAVSAALLQQAGAQVTSVFIKGWYPPGMPCTWAADRRDAMRVAARLHIPFITLDASAEYKKSVIDYLLTEYRAGRTPNPDIMCNRDVKFGAFYRFAKESGADAIATGHYESGEKDQRYFLWAVPQEILHATLFPVGHLEKREVRALAKRFHLPVAEKRDSQGVCFLGSVSIEEFLRSELGSDNPALLYTLGQRIPRPGGPWYVVGKDVEHGEVTVSKTRASTAHMIRFHDANWFDDPSSATEAQYRYRGQYIKGRIENDTFTSTDLLPEIPAPGQSIVFYHNDELIGGGIIRS